MSNHSDIKGALIRAIVDFSSQNGMLDPGDREMLVKYHVSHVSKSELDAFALAKTKRIKEQEKRPQ